MKKRCRNKNDSAYKNYGGRGIGVCARWSIFENFLEDMGKRPSKKHSIDRFNNDGNYEPGNCRWATLTEQARNRRSSHFVMFGDSRMTIAELSSRTGIHFQTLLYRIKDMGMTPLDAVACPIKRNKIGYAGVSRARGRFQARAVRGGKRVSLGCFDTAEEAGLAYRKAEGK